MNIHNTILVNNPCYKAGQKITVKGLMLHSVGCSQPKAQAFVDYWGLPTANVCVHALIDGLTGEVYQTLPWNHCGWHCGKGVNGSGNLTHIGVEMCEPDCIKYTGGATFTCSNVARAKEIATRTYNSAVELFAYLCKQYGLNPLADGVIISHSEGHRRGISSNHADPEHLWNQLGMGYTMDGFRQAVWHKLNGAVPTPTPSPSPTPSGFPSVPFTVNVKVSDLNVRRTPDMGNNVFRQTGKGVFTIVEVTADKWGLLKAYASTRSGWIYLGNSAYLDIIGSPSSPFPNVPFSVQVLVPDLNYRSEPSMNGRVKGQTGRGVFTIVEVTADKWGKLKSGAGWIYLGNDTYTRVI